MTKNKRCLYFLLIIITIPLGLGTRSTHATLPAILATYGGDILSATCIFFGVRFLAPGKPLWQVAIAAYFICICIETLQLFQAPWIQTVRHTYPFGLLLGYGFLWSDLVCYAVGAVVAVVMANLLEKLFFGIKRDENDV
ncbi:DUF2809 domain-containing protein [Segetibacter sp.]|uniref:ribosomal maturation YjgA family protein n=1 Tax=Segetibacter sp. TaxID=2231182 RepID=UPI00262707F5|nr:DUF2809 domain-containing protein [Segetibacter sp.]